MSEQEADRSAAKKRRVDIWMPGYCHDDLAISGQLQPLEWRALTRLRNYAWLAGGALPLDENRLRMMAMMTPAQWKRAKPILLSFFVEHGGAYHNDRIDEELAKAIKNKGQKSGAGSASAEARKKALLEAQAAEKTTNMGNGCSPAVATDEERRGNPLPSPLPSKEERTNASHSPAPAGVVIKLPARDKLWQDGVRIIRDATGKSQDAAKSMLGRFVADAKNDCNLVLAVLLEAADLRPIEFVAWVKGAIKFRMKPPDRDGFMELAKRRAREDGEGRYEPTPNPVQALLANEAAEAERRNARG